MERRDEADRGPGEVDARPFGAVAGGLPAGADAPDAHDRLLHALQIVQAGHGRRRYQWRPQPFGVTTARLRRSPCRNRSYATGASSKAKSSTSTRSSPVSASAITSCRSAIDAAIGMNRSHSSGSTPHDTFAVPPPAPTIAIVPRLPAQASAIAIVASSATKS